jgi:phosphoglycolate phosphatase
MGRGGRLTGLRFRLIVFDFDGTLVDSNVVKRDAFDHVFADCPECLRAVPSTLDQYRDASRVEIIRALVERIADLSTSEWSAEAARRTEAYSSWVEDQIAQRAEHSPATVLLPQWQRAAALYVCSLTPTAALVQILQRLNWLQYFDGVEGYPVSKRDMLQRTMTARGVAASEVLMVGDGDEAAATATGTAFFRIGAMHDLERLNEYLLQ